MSTVRIERGAVRGAERDGVHSFLGTPYAGWQRRHIVRGDAMSTGGPAVTTYTPPAGLRAIISGVGGVREHLAETLRAQGVRRPMILCGRNVGATPLGQVVAAAAGMECAIFKGSQEHTPISAVDSGRDAARDCGADGLIAHDRGGTEPRLR